MFVQLNLAFFIPYLNTNTKRQHTYKKKSKTSILLLLQCSYEDDLRKPSLLLVLIDAAFIHSNLLAQPSVHAKSASYHLPKQNENLWGAVVAGVSYFRPRGLVNPTRSPILTPSGGDPSQQAQPGSITPRRAVKCLLCICRRVLGDAVMDISTACVNTALRSLTQIQANNIISSFWEEYMIRYASNWGWS